MGFSMRNHKKWAYFLLVVTFHEPYSRVYITFSEQNQPNKKAKRIALRPARFMRPAALRPHPADTASIPPRWAGNANHRHQIMPAGIGSGIFIFLICDPLALLFYAAA